MAWHCAKVTESITVYLNNHDKARKDTASALYKSPMFSRTAKTKAPSDKVYIET